MGNETAEEYGRGIVGMTLAELPFDTDARVVAINGESGILRRLMEMGVIPGVTIKRVKTAPFGDPMEVRVRGYSLALRRSEADSVEVSI